MNRKILIDANVLFYIIKNKPNVPQIYEALGNYAFPCISSLSLFFVHTKLLRSKGIDKELLHEYTDTYRDFIAECQVLDFTNSTIEQADKICANLDWEDAVQVATALANKCDAILTCDQELRDSYNKLIKVIYIPKD